jgi:predicted ATP-grasp superfamily ATP-dependent carboligase
MKCVLILGAEDSPALIVAETFRKRGFRVIVGCHIRMCITFFSRYPHKRVLYPSPDTCPEAFVSWLFDFITSEKVDVLIPADTQTPQLVSKYKNELKKIVNLYLVDFHLYKKALDKAETMKIAIKNNIPCPKTYFPEEKDIDEIKKMIEEYPVLIKPRFGLAARGITFVKSKNALVETFSKIESKHGKCIIQEYIPHNGMQFKAEILMNKQQETLSWVVYNKPRHYPPEGGSSTINCTVDRIDILTIAERILKAMGWYGMGDCDFIEDPRDKTPKLMEINPRFTRSIKIASIAGVDFFYKLYQLAIGEEVQPDKNFKVGMYLRYLPSDIMWFLKSKDRFKAKPSFFKFYSRNMKYEICSMKDPGAIIGYLLHSLLLKFNKNEKQNRKSRIG